MVQEIKHNQSLLDFAIQHSGGLASLLDYAFLNGLSVSDDLTPGEKLNVPNTTAKDIDIVNYFNDKRIIPALGLNGFSLGNQDDGIGFMKIGSNFKIG